MTYKQLNKDQREVIQILINKKENFKLLVILLRLIELPFLKKLKEIGILKVIIMILLTLKE